MNGVLMLLFKHFEWLRDHAPAHAEADVVARLEAGRRRVADRT